MKEIKGGMEMKRDRKGWYTVDIKRTEIGMEMGEKLRYGSGKDMEWKGQ